MVGNRTTALPILIGVMIFVLTPCFGMAYTATDGEPLNNYPSWNTYAAGSAGSYNDKFVRIVDELDGNRVLCVRFTQTPHWNNNWNIHNDLTESLGSVGEECIVSFKLKTADSLSNIYIENEHSAAVGTKRVQLSTVTNVVELDGGREGWKQFSINIPTPITRLSLKFTGGIDEALVDDISVVLDGDAAQRNYVANGSFDDQVFIRKTTQLGTTVLESTTRIPGDVSCELQWISSDEYDGIYNDIYKQTSSQYVPSPPDKNKYIKLRVTPTDSSGEAIGEPILSNAHKVVTLGPVSTNTGKTATQVADTAINPEAYKFRIEGSKWFVLLDEYMDNESAFYVMAADSNVHRKFDLTDPVPTDKTEVMSKFDPENPDNIAWYLNNDEMLRSQMFPQKILEYIDETHVWWNEALNSTDGDYQFTAGVALLSRLEFVKYMNRYGWTWNTDASVSWWLRTHYDSKSADSIFLAMAAPSDSRKGDLADYASTSSFYLRPTFYLNRSFFKEVKLEVSSVGAQVKNMLAERYEIGELLFPTGPYSRQELEAMGIIREPEIGRLKMTGSFRVSETVTASYAFTNGKEGNSQYGFEISDSLNGNYISVADMVKSYTLKQTDLGKYIRFYLTPRDASGNSGQRQTTASVQICEASTLRVTNAAFTDAVGDTITNLNAAPRLYASAQIENISETEKDYILLMYVYDSDGNMLVNRLSKGVVSENSTITLEDLYIDTPAYNEGNYAKFFLWDTLNGMTILLSEPVVLR